MALVATVVFGELVQPLMEGHRTMFIDLNAKARLLDTMNEGDYTFGTIVRANSAVAEVVKITATGGQFVVERGYDGTKDMSHPVGSCIDTRPTHSWIKEHVCVELEKLA